MNVCDNLGDHLVGNVFVKFKREEDAEKAVADLNNRWYEYILYRTQPACSGPVVSFNRRLSFSWVHDVSYVNSVQFTLTCYSSLLKQLHVCVLLSSFLSALCHACSAALF
jgi:hypothetical protein